MTNLSSTPTTSTPKNTASLSKDGYMRIMPIADYLGIHHQTVRRYVKQGRMPAPKLVCGVQLFDMTEIKQWLETGQVNASTKTEGA